jgi:hypothetical protein
VHSFTIFVYNDYRYAGDGVDYVFSMTVWASTLDIAIERVRNMVGPGHLVTDLDLSGANSDI